MNKKAKTAAVKKVTGYRKTCAANGTGLSHYIVVDPAPKTKRK